MTPATDPLVATARALARAVAGSDALRAERDRLIAEALGRGEGVREVARRAGVNPTHVMRVKRRRG